MKDINTFLDCKSRCYFGFLDCYMCGERHDLIIDCDNQMREYGCPNGYAK